jgi:serine/threonine protein phosphatase PrpC
LFVAALADGCSEGRASEVGAQLATRFAVRWIERSWRALRHCASTEIARLLERALLSYLEAVFEPLSTEESRALLIRDMGLFTLFVLIADEDRTVVLGLGADIHQVRRFLPSRPDQPDYVAYRLLPNLAGPARLSAVYEESTDRVSGLLVATDGLFSLSDAEILTLIRQQASASNPLALERQLRVFAHRKRRLQDDATAILLDREGGSPCV